MCQGICPAGRKKRHECQILFDILEGKENGNDYGLKIQTENNKIIRLGNRSADSQEWERLI